MACYTCWRSFGQFRPTREEVVAKIYEVGHTHLVPAEAEIYAYGRNVGEPSVSWRLPFGETPTDSDKFRREFGFEPVVVAELDRNLLADTQDARKGSFWVEADH